MSEALSNRRARLALLIVWLLFVACSANRMHRPVSVEEHPDYSIAFVEFDDQGELWAPAQLDSALALLEDRGRSGTGVAVVLFVHGWNSSAAESEEREGKGTVYQFRELLTRLRRSHQRRYPGVDIPVVGVYLGWRGEVSTVPLVRQLSFYNRRGAAERISGSSATEAIYRLLTAARANPMARSVLIGHSFGSMILERALAQAVVSALLAAPGEELVFPADLVVLLNPAGSAIQTKQLVDILARNRLKTYRVDEEGRRYERPLLLSFTSEADKATRVFFPLGMGLKAVNKKFRPYGSEYCSPISKQRWLYSHTPGHTPALFSHQMSVGPKVGHRPTESAQESPEEVAPRFEADYDPQTQQMAFSFDGEDHRFTIRRKPRALNDTPYWIMQVPAEMIPNHSAVFSQDTFALAEAALGFSGAMEAGASTVVVKEDGVRPVAVVPRPDGGALFVDRSRGVYAVRPESSHPIFVSCLTEDVDPSEGVGFQVAGHLAYLVMVRPESGTESKCQTEHYEFQVDNDGYRLLGRTRLGGSDCYTAAAFDLAEKHVYLSAEGEAGVALYSADMSKEGVKPDLWLTIPGSGPGTGPVTALYVESVSRRLFATRAEDGELWATDLDGDPPRPRLVSDSLGWPMAIGFGRQSRELYVTDAKNQRIWALDCEDRCGAPRVFYQAESLRNPTALAVALDGTVWLGDREEQTLTTIAPTGEIGTVIRSLTGDN